MPAAKAYSYAVLRVVPRVEREEFLNAGVVLFSQEWRYLAARVHLDPERLLALCSCADMKAAARHLQAVVRICQGDPSAGVMAALPQKDRFHWLTAPRSTTIQISPIRTGISHDPEHTLEHLMRELVH